MPEIYNLLFDKISVIVFYKNNFSTYFVILVSDFDNLKLHVGFCIVTIWMFYKIFNYTQNVNYA